MDGKQDNDNGKNTTRLDKWLWSARIFRTRSQASMAIRTGKVRLNGNRIKSGRTVTSGDMVLIRRGAVKTELEVLDLPQTRLAAKDAVNSYRETAESLAARTQTQALLQAATSGVRRTRGKPGKRERRQLLRFTGKKA